MPAYNYRCPKCGWEGERMFVSYERRNVQRCSECRKSLGPPQLTAKMGKPEFQPGAVVYDGEKAIGTVKGHFGKAAKVGKKK